MKIVGIPMGTIGTNCYIISDDSGTAAIIDCDGDPTPLFEYVAENSLTPTHILLTHGHYDHIGAVAEVKEKYGCMVYGGKEEMPVFTDARVNCSSMVGVPILVYPDVTVSDGDTIQVGGLSFQVLLTPGHTIGSLCFIAEDNLFSGDTLFQGSCGRTDLPTGDTPAMLSSLQRLAALPGNYNVFSGHGPATTLDIERAYNPYISMQ